MHTSLLLALFSELDLLCVPFLKIKKTVLFWDVIEMTPTTTTCLKFNREIRSRRCVLWNIWKMKSFRCWVLEWTVSTHKILHLSSKQTKNGTGIVEMKKKRIIICICNIQLRCGRCVHMDSWDQNYFHPPRLKS